MKAVISRFIMVLGALFFIGILFSREFRLELGQIVESVLFFLSPYPFHVVILIMSILTGIYSNLIQKFTIDYKRMKEIQKILREYQKEYIEATKQNNQFKLKQLEQKKNEIQQIQSEMMSMQFKPMLYTFVVTIPIFAWLWEKASASYELVVVAPFAGQIHVVTPVLIFPWWLFWYLLCSITFGQIIKKVLRVGV